MASDAATLVAPEIWRITTPLPFRPRTVHAYLVRSHGEWLLVDGGVNTDEAWATLAAGVDQAAGGWERLARHLVTHMHIDHLGLAGRVRKATGAPLLMGRLDAERAAHAHLHPEEEAEYRALLLREHGAPPEAVAAVQGSREAANPLSSFVPVDLPLPPETAAVPGVQGWIGVPTPGHTAGHLSLFRPADGILIAGDAVLPRVTPTIGVNRQRADPVGDYLAALDRVAELNPSRILPGHGEPIEDPPRRIAQLRDATTQETERVWELLSAAGGTAWQVAQARYPDRDLPASMRLQALRETLAHLDHLAAVGRARRERVGGVVRFWPL